MMRHDIFEAGSRYGLSKPLHAYTRTDYVAEASKLTGMPELDIVACIVQDMLTTETEGSA